MKIQEGDIVRTLVDKRGFSKGSKGLVCWIFIGGPECLVEIWDETNYPIDVIIYAFNELELIERFTKWWYKIYEC